MSAIKRPAGRCHGFTLLELAIVMIVIGVLMVPFLQSYQVYLADQKRRQTLENMQAVENAIFEFYANFQRYPCPAEPNKSPGDPTFGQEVCPGLPSATNPPIAGDCLDSLCRAMGRDADGDGPDDDDLILIGAVPLTTLQAILEESDIALQETQDAWFGKITYAVTERLTDTASFNSQFGGIAVLDENGNSLMDPPARAHYVLVSHGDDGLSAYTAEGGNPQDCAIGTPQYENCVVQDTDSVFMSGLRSVGTPADYNDDIVRYVYWASSTLWSFSPLNPDNIFNTNIGNVGINVQDPTDRLHVGGGLRAVQVEADQICDPTGVCMLPEVIGGAGMRCPPGEAVVSIENNDVNCAPILGGTPTGTCPPGQYVTGYSNVSGPICN